MVTHKRLIRYNWHSKQVNTIEDEIIELCTQARRKCTDFILALYVTDHSHGIKNHSGKTLDSWDAY